MTQFQASLIAGGDPNPLPTTVALHEGKLSIESNGQAIGDWSLEDLEFERIVGGFRVTLDGEVAVLKLPESDQFNEELKRLNGAGPDGKPDRKAESKPKRKSARKKAKASATAAAPRQEPEPKTSAAPVANPPAATTAVPATSKAKTSLNWLDTTLERAHARWERYLPDWFFTRGGVAVAAVLLIAIIVFRDIFYILFLLLAALGLITSAVGLMDQVIATRIFRRGFTPVHGLIGSLALVLFGVLLGAI